MKEKEISQVKILHAHADSYLGQFDNMANTIIRGMYMDSIRKFLEDGQKHGTVVEALYEAFNSILTGAAKDIPSALYVGASEWYK